MVALQVQEVDNEQSLSAQQVQSERAAKSLEVSCISKNVLLQAPTHGVPADVRECAHSDHASQAHWEECEHRAHNTHTKTKK
jgi:hypothetical protein